jgi:hypothetical protein
VPGKGSGARPDGSLPSLSCKSQRLLTYHWFRESRRRFLSLFVTVMLDAARPLGCQHLSQDMPSSLGAPCALSTTPASLPGGEGLGPVTSTRALFPLLTPAVSLHPGLPACFENSFTEIRFTIIQFTT